MNQWCHWQLDWDETHVVWLMLQVNDRSANVLHQRVLSELNEVLDWLEQANPRGVIVGTQPGDSFALGADVAEFEQLETYEQVLQMVQTGQGVFERWSRQKYPTVAAIRGYCLGGGLEFALACDYRVAEDSSDVRLGLPEVLLGIHPGYGGTVRLPRLIGDFAALRLMLSGKTVSASAAVAMGLLDTAVAGRQLFSRALQFLEGPPRPAARVRWYQHCPHLVPLRRLLAIPYARAARRRANPEHYPAPYQLLQHWQDLPRHQTRALDAEAASLAELVESPASRQLVRVFLLRERLKRQHAEGKRIQQVHVVGAGVMGGDIAAWCALCGLRVTLQDTDPERLASALKRAHELFARRSHLRREAWDRLLPDVDGRGAESAQIVIEAIPENLELKQDLYYWLEERMCQEAVLATNTSSLPLHELAEGLRHPERLIGVHFFNPVARMPLVELIYHCKGQEADLMCAGRFARQINRTGVVVRSSPGFLVNRILMPYLLEAAQMVEEGLAPATVDRAAKDFGMPMGPLEVADMVGLDICLSAGGVIAEHCGLDVPPIIQQYVDEGRLGRKKGVGFYRWKGKHNTASRPRKAPADCQDRLILGMVRAAVQCLHEGVVADADMVDVGVILGTGFAPWTGGPLQIARTQGVAKIRKRLSQLEQQYGARFAPGEDWEVLQP